MKTAKLLCLILTLALIFSTVAACGGSGADSTTEFPSVTVTENTTEASDGTQTTGAAEEITDGTEDIPDTTAPAEDITGSVTPDGTDATEPASTPSEPKPTDPKPTEPKPTEPKETEPAHKHSYSKSTVKPTCTKKGYDLYKCSCGDSYKENYKDAKGHSYSGSTTAPTCTEKGYTLYKCSACGDSYKENYKDATGHKWSDWVTTKEPTTSEEGKKERTCSACGKTETAAIEKKPAEVIDTAALEAYGRKYAYETYGYDGNPNCNPSTGAGYFPGVTAYVYTMEDGYRHAREAVDAQYNNDIGGGRQITAEIDGTLRRRKINVYFEATDTPNKYIIWVYYGGTADPYYK